jgi:hypothetical protein
MKEHSFDRLIETRTSVAEPHFDDERTLLSARQVVPLEKIDAKVRYRRKWFLGGAFAVAMMLGAASALVASYFKLRNVENTAHEISQVEISAPALQTEETLTSESSAIATVEEPIVPAVEPKKESTERRRTVVRRDSVEIEPRITPGLDEEDDLERIRAAVLYDEWQERRARRATRRERRRADRSHRDLSNLDEIFEGPRRPY